MEARCIVVLRSRLLRCLWLALSTKFNFLSAIVSCGENSRELCVRHACISIRAWIRKATDKCPHFFLSTLTQRERRRKNHHIVVGSSSDWRHLNRQIYPLTIPLNVIDDCGAKHCGLCRNSVFCLPFFVRCDFAEDCVNISFRRLHSQVASSERKCTRILSNLFVSSFIGRWPNTNTTISRRKRVINIWENYNSDKFSTLTFHSLGEWMNEWSFILGLLLLSRNILFAVKSFLIPFRNSSVWSANERSALDIHNVLPRQNEDKVCAIFTLKLMTFNALLLPAFARRMKYNSLTRIEWYTFLFANSAPNPVGVNV